jgi:hypothetical protein
MPQRQRSGSWAPGTRKSDRDDDLISTTRYALMCLRFARPARENGFLAQAGIPGAGVV